MQTAYGNGLVMVWKLNRKDLFVCKYLSSGVKHKHHSVYMFGKTNYVIAGHNYGTIINNKVKWKD